MSELKIKLNKNSKPGLENFFGISPERAKEMIYLDPDNIRDLYNIFTNKGELIEFMINEAKPQTNEELFALASVWGVVDFVFYKQNTLTHKEFDIKEKNG